MLARRSLDALPHPGAAPLVRSANAGFAPKPFHKIIGPSGCGKVTQLKRLLGILPTRGDILMRGSAPIAPAAHIHPASNLARLGIARTGGRLLDDIAVEAEHVAAK
jgi:ABC-type cobalamin/Fe3+-siderophores transport system ATPase subunit